MGALASSAQEQIALPYRCLVGRSALAQLRIASDYVSSEHAVLYWDDDSWHVRDLGSRNGTLVNGGLLRGDSRSLALGDRLGFGGPNEDWTLVDASEPEPCAIKGDGAPPVPGKSKLLILPTEKEPEASIFLTGDDWHAEVDGVLRPVGTGDWLSLPSGRWQLLLPVAPQGPSRATAQAPFTLGDISLEFRVSRHEERVAVTIRYKQETRVLPTRSYLYTLLALAREVVADGGHEDAGWIHPEDLAQQLACTREKLNLDIHRLRRLFQVAGVADFGDVVERRAESHELRLGVRRVSIELEG